MNENIIEQSIKRLEKDLQHPDIHIAYLNDSNKNEIISEAISLHQLSKEQKMSLIINSEVTSSESFLGDTNTYFYSVCIINEGISIVAKEKDDDWFEEIDDLYNGVIKFEDILTCELAKDNEGENSILFNLKNNEQIYVNVKQFGNLSARHNKKQINAILKLIDIILSGGGGTEIEELIKAMEENMDKKFYPQIIDIADEFFAKFGKDNQSATYIYTMVAEAYFNMKKYDYAEKNADLALELSQKLNGKPDINSLLIKGHIQYARDKVLEAYKIYKQSYSLTIDSQQDNAYISELLTTVYNELIKYLTTLPRAVRRIVAMWPELNKVSFNEIFPLNVYNFPAVEYYVEKIEKGDIFILHPFKNDYYLPLDKNSYILFVDKLKDLYKGLELLGAKTIKTKKIEGLSFEELSTLGVINYKLGKYKNFNAEDNSNSIKEDFQDLKWFNNNTILAKFADKIKQKEQNEYSICIDNSDVDLLDENFLNKLKSEFVENVEKFDDIDNNIAEKFFMPQKLTKWEIICTF